MLSTWGKEKSSQTFRPGSPEGLRSEDPIIPLTRAAILLQQKVLGGDFFNKVCGHLKLLEKEYFGLEFRHHSGNYVRKPHEGGRGFKSHLGALKNVRFCAGVVRVAEAARQAD